MSVLIVPTSQTDTLYEQVTILDGREYVLKFDWSTREEAWYFSIYDQDEVALATNIKLVISLPLLYRETNKALPPGLLMAVDLSGDDAEAGVSDLGTRVALLYEEAA